MENDAEHSYQLTMLSWYIVDVFGLDLNKDLVLKYSLVHDLVETYAGDTYIFDKNENLHTSKEEREHQALERIKSEFPEFSELWRYIVGYEKKLDNESKFVYALDKIIPVINIYLDWGKTWKNLDIFQIVLTLKKLRENKDPKVRIYPELYRFWEEFCEILEKNQKDLFLE